MLADDTACNPRNPKASAVYNNRAQGLNLYGEHVEVRGLDFLDTFTCHHQFEDVFSLPLVRLGPV